jgi:hypothetical protein
LHSPVRLYVQRRHGIAPHIYRVNWTLKPNFTFPISTF